MSPSAVMMAARQPPITALAMKMILKATSKRLASILAGMRANVPRREEVDYRCHRRAPLATDPPRIPAYLRRHRFDADALNPWREVAR
jgi:hypothetical protein